MLKTVEDFLLYLKVEKNYSQNTINSYKTDVTQFIEECDVSDFAEVTPSKIRFFLGVLANKNISAKSRNRKLSAVRTFFDFLVIEGVAHHNPAQIIKRAKTGKRLPKAISVDEMANTIDSAENDRDLAVLEVLYATGSRVSELASIKVSDVNFESNTISLIGKGDRQRLVPLTNSATRAISNYISTRKIQSEYLFPNRQGNKMSRNAIYNIVKKYNTEISPHVFRHSYATHLNATGVDIRQLQALLGHSDISTTSIYTAVLDETLSNSVRMNHPRS